ncbi:hypothetical protein PTNB73_06504 [Pyrenophora teres f. teres]|uniref:Uncharacterized protein n=1 Tax=Pyrenophora teres f. teres TaxID=97479 RepID=A0A6S6W5X7_9PLEO|nr:hypothetical protein PTNB85_07232 [Pyrenophora teres f. teres]KAE8863297.1 hypothetical protein PTNB73_06504 [Pyrenophora teres f. teres]CAE7186268.1 hypothetical protein PTTW11_06940 [Pyrenophora teres f. teres]
MTMTTTMTMLLVLGFVFVFFSLLTGADSPTNSSFARVTDVAAELNKIADILQKIEGHVTPVLPSPVLAFTFFFIFFSNTPACFAAAWDRLVGWASKPAFEDTAGWFGMVVKTIKWSNTMLSPFRLEEDWEDRVRRANARADDAEDRARVALADADSRNEASQKLRDVATEHTKQAMENTERANVDMERARVDMERARVDMERAREDTERAKAQVAKLAAMKAIIDSP